MSRLRDRNILKRNKVNTVYIFIITTFFFAMITTIQFFILGNYIDYNRVEMIHTFMIVFFWLLCSVTFTYVTYRNISKLYDQPLKRFARVTNQVANGDFSVYVEPLHSGDRMDYLDYMFIDFNKMVEELGSIETLKTDFISNVSHEIKTPIAVIKNYSEYLQKQDLNEEERLEYARTIELAAKRLSELISGILKLNKLENQRIKPEFSEYSISDQLAECAIAMEEVWDAKNIEFTADLEDRAMIYADESLMEIVWNNLLSNAIKFTPEGGQVFLKQESDGKTVTVSLSDTGCGMTRETIKHIFDKFYQGDTSHSRDGNGLGLALSRRILQLHDAEIRVESEVGKGSVFTVTIPRLNPVVSGEAETEEYVNE